MIRPCDTCDGSGQVKKYENFEMDLYLLEPCPSCADMPWMWVEKEGIDDTLVFVTEQTGLSFKAKPDPSTVMRWCQTHGSRWWNGTHRCIEALYRVVHEMKEDVAPCQFVWVAVPEPLEEA